MNEEGVNKLSDTEREVWDDLVAWTYNFGWARPMDVGGRDASDHSRVLAKLVKLGLAERKRRPSIMNSLGSRRGSYLYRTINPPSASKGSKL
jgi:predicted transcriptional regulator